MRRRLVGFWATWILTAGLLTLVTTEAAALQIDFSEFGHGQVVESSQGVDITFENFTGPDLGVAFLTTESGTADPDLEMGSGWDGGNLDPSTMLDQILIIQEHIDSCANGFCLDPDDEGSRPAGSITFDFRPVGSFDQFAFDLVDVENTTMEDGGLVFLLGGPGGLEVASVGFAEFVGVSFGDNHINRVDLGVVGLFDTVRIDVGGSAGFDNVTVDVPEPSTGSLLLGALLAAIGLGRRRVRRAVEA